jgi:hypothetical protein
VDVGTQNSGTVDVAQTMRAGHDRIQNGLKLRRRAADDVQDFAGRGLLFERLSQSVVARFDLRAATRAVDRRREMERKHCKQMQPLQRQPGTSIFVIGDEDAERAAARADRDDDKAVRAQRRRCRIGRTQSRVRWERMSLIDDEGFLAAMGHCHRAGFLERNFGILLERKPVGLRDARAGDVNQAIGLRRERPDGKTVDTDRLACGIQHVGDLLLERKCVLQCCGSVPEPLDSRRQLIEFSSSWI